MLTGFAFLDHHTDDDVNKKALQHRLKEVALIKCTDCGATFRLFAGPDFADGSVEASSDIKDLSERANQFIFRDCPATVPERQPRKPGHVREFELLDNGKIAV